MPFFLKMPALSPTMKSGKIMKWHLKNGDTIEVGQLISEIETDKASMDFESNQDFVLVKILKNDPTEVIEVKTNIAICRNEDEDDDDIDEFLKQNESSSDAVNNNKNIEAENSNVEEKKKNASDIRQYDNNKRLKASPLARNIAKNNNVDLEQIDGSGPYGRIIKNDVLQYMEDSSSKVNAFSIANKQTKEDRVEQPSEMRKVIARRLVESKQQIPHFYVGVDCVLDAVLCLRKKVNDENTKITINDFVIKASALAMQELSNINVSWQNDEIIHFGSVDVAVAVSLDEGLITPIIVNADQKSLLQLSQEMKDLANRARNGKLQPHEFQGGGFTISNLGMFGIPQFQAIINPPQAAILAVGAGQKSIVIDENNNQIIKTIMKLNLSVDHRVIDGGLAAQFLNKIKFFLENPEKMLIV